jgi:hypothetical protein
MNQEKRIGDNVKDLVKPFVEKIELVVDKQGEVFYAKEKSMM